MCHYSQKAEAASSSSKFRRVGNRLMDAVGVDVFDGADVIVYCFVGVACAVANGAVDAAEGYSGGCQFVCIVVGRMNMAYSTRITSTGSDHLSFATAQRLNCSFVTLTPTLQSVFSLSPARAVTPSGAAS